MSSVRGLQGVNKSDIVVLKSLASPPKPVCHVLAATWLLLGNSTTNHDFRNYKRMLADTNFMDSEVPDKISAKALADAQKELELAGSVERVKQVAAACAGLYMWATKRASEVKAE